MSHGLKIYEMKKTLLLTLLSFLILSTAYTQVPTNGLVAYYPFNGNANDVSGNGNDGTVHGATLTTDRFSNVGKAYSFDGNDLIEVSGSKSSYFEEDFTITLWLNFENMNNNIFSFPSSLYQTSLYIDVISYGSYSQIGSRIINSSLQNYSQLNRGNWYQVCLIVKDNFQKIYIDGVPSGHNAQISDSRLGIARYGYNLGGRYSRLLIGKLDDIRIYNRALSDAEVLALYDGESSSNQPPLIYSSEVSETIEKGTPLKVNFKAKTKN